MEFKKYSIEEFIDDLSSDSEAPGGGSTSGLIMALAGSLNNMIYSLTIDKKTFEKLTLEEKKQMVDFKNQTDKFIKKAIDLMEEDRRAFKALMEGYRLPKDLENRKEKIEKLTFDALNAPLEMAKLGVEFYKNIRFAIEYGNKNLVTDGGVAATLLHGAIEGSILNVKVNLKYFSNIDEKEKIKKEILDILNFSKKEKESIVSIVNKEIE